MSKNEMTTFWFIFVHVQSSDHQVYILKLALEPEDVHRTVQRTFPPLPELLLFAPCNIFSYTLNRIKHLLMMNE